MIKKLSVAALVAAAGFTGTAVAGEFRLSGGLGASDAELNSDGTTLEFEQDGLATRGEFKFVADGGFTVGVNRTSSTYDRVCGPGGCGAFDLDIVETNIYAGYTWSHNDRDRPEFTIVGGLSSFALDNDSGLNEDEDGLTVIGGAEFFAGPVVSFPMQLQLFNLEDSVGAAFQIGLRVNLADEHLWLGAHIRGLALQDENNDDYSSGQRFFTVGASF